MNHDYLEWKNWEAASFGKCSSEAEKYLAWHLRRAFPGDASQLNVLEVGFGNGEFLAFCRSRGFRVTGVEISKELVDRAIQNGYSAVGTVEEALAAGPFDLIAAFDVLEHLDTETLKRFLGDVRNGLSARGCLLVRVPNGDSPFGLRHQHGDLTHVTTFGIFKFHQIARMCKLEVIATREAPWYIDPAGKVGLKSALRGLLKAAIELVVGFAYFKERVPLDPNLVVVMKKVPEGGQ